ncbi:hypothetical protein MMC11_001231 [Xylographa trunciseda]|nr:hypothetical protein [Xylographa trunciseda]
MSPNNTAAWQVAAKARPLEIRPSPYISPQEGEIVVKNGAVAINPADCSIQATDMFNMKYPVILGSDLAGEVVEVGGSVTRFSKGDRVLGMALQFTSSRESDIQCESAFQTYTVLQERTACKIPSTMSFEQAAVIPLGLSTAAVGMFQEDYLNLQYPSLDPKPTGQTLIVWGGSSSVGSNAIQLGVAAGYQVITTASPRNFEYVKKLGASQVFDYNSKTIVDELVAATKDKTTAGVIDCINIDGAIQACADTLLKCEGNRFIATCKLPPENFSPDGVSHKFIVSWGLKDTEVSKVIFEDFVPQALAQAKYIAAPDPYVVGKGLEYVQEAMDILVKGVSAKKIVVSL